MAVAHVSSANSGPARKFGDHHPFIIPTYIVAGLPEPRAHQGSATPSAGSICNLRITNSHASVVRPATVMRGCGSPIMRAAPGTDRPRSALQTASAGKRDCHQRSAISSIQYA